MQELIVTKNDAGQRLDKLLAKYLNKAPKSFYYKMLRKKNITLNGKKADGSEKLAVDDVIKFFLSDETIASFQEEVKVLKVNHNLSVLYEDDNVLIVNKPVGLLSQKAEKQDISLNEHIISYLIDNKSLTSEGLAHFKPGICNRLDRNTSGIVVAGKSLIGLQTMSQLFHDRTIHKFYRCIVVGKMIKKEKISAYLYKDEHTNKVTVLNEYEMDRVKSNRTNGIDSDLYDRIETEYEPILWNDDFTLLEVKLITGKTHQIRAHLASISHPLIGDFKYGKDSVNRKLKEVFGLKHQLLHAYRIEFPKLDGECQILSNKEFIAKEPNHFVTIQKQIFG